MDLRPYAPAAEAHENFSNALKKNGFVKMKHFIKTFFFVKIAISFLFS
jgi:hypothetical protein